MSNLPIG